ncbi:replicative DNA helicase [Pilimelia columellifera]|uniref:replicative DNA helicase n=1 Tax=Pilimelia columellifera TaxID=706574 RepID=UPI0031D72E9E
MIPEGRRPADSGYDRTPPQDLAAEQCVLGGMLLSKDAIADVIEILKPGDFYRPHHATVFDAVLDLYGRGEPADAITVAASLADAGDLARIGGAPYLHTLIAAVPTAANAAYYARIVGERAILRRLVEAGTRIAQLGYGANGNNGRDVDDIVDLAQQAIYDVTEKRVSEDFAVLADMLQPTLDEIEAVGASGGMMTGVPTGFSDLDRLLNGLHAGQLVIVAGRPGLGKALALDTPLPTPDGWTTMGAVRVGDLLIGADGRPVEVTAATATQHGRSCFAVEFSDGSVIVADADHRWSTRSRRPRRAAVVQVRTTAQIRRTLRDQNHQPNHSIPTAAPLALPRRDDLPVPPYAVGSLLGGGRIPAAYLRAAEDQRRDLLAGLLDADGEVGPTGNVRYRTTCAELADDVYELVVGLGYRCALNTTPAGGRPVSTSAFVLSFATVHDVFRSERKRLTHQRRRRADGGAGVRTIVEVRPVPSVPVRCVSVANADHLYLAGRSMIPTHNSTAAMDFARSASLKNNLASCIFSLEMSKVEIVMRLLSAEARVPLHVLRSGQLSDDDWTKLARRMGEISEAPLFVDDTASMNLMEIRAKARRLKQRHDLKLIVVDYLQLMTSPKKTESRQQEVSELSRGLKLLAKEVECPVIAVSQLNRGPEQRTDKRPQLSDLRESGCLTASTRLLRADNGAETTLGELVATGARNIPVWAVDETLRCVPRMLSHAFPSGRKAVFRMSLASGRQVEATPNHRFLTVDGWRALATLGAGSRIAVPRHVPAPTEPTIVPDGLVAQAAETTGGRVPTEVFGLARAQVALFLRRLWAKGGSVTVDQAAGGGEVRYGAASRRCADDLARLLLRFGIVGRVTTVRSGATLEISGRDDQLRFVREIGGHGGHRAACVALRAVLESRPSVPADAAPAAVTWDRVRELLTAPSGGALAQVVEVLDAVDLDIHATNDVLWDPVVAIEPIGEQDVYDATVLGLHNFIADGVVAHNSIEQDADVVILLHRDDYYDKESPRAGEADFIVAKHRNGPTDTITVAAQLHLSRFVDMAL